jgi:hypothetical protein
LFHRVKYNVLKNEQQFKLTCKIVFWQELGSGVLSGRQIAKEEQHAENISLKHLEPTVCIKEEPQSLPMDYPYPAMPSNFSMVPQAWSMSQPLHLQRTEQTFPDLAEKTILNLASI